MACKRSGTVSYHRCFYMVKQTVFFRFGPAPPKKMRYRPFKSTVLVWILCFISRKQVALAIGSRYFRFFKTKQKVAKTKKNHGKSRGFYGDHERSRYRSKKNIFTVKMMRFQDFHIYFPIFSKRLVWISSPRETQTSNSHPCKSPWNAIEPSEF